MAKQKITECRPSVFNIANTGLAGNHLEDTMFADYRVYRYPQSSPPLPPPPSPSQTLTGVTPVTLPVSDKRLNQDLRLPLDSIS
ncbi:hypothetical protein J6590_064538 [Homalodisca vitripennis]|nr:hypothetical protein J6590_064538 [Homalodisca vitripennis]